MVNTDFLSLAVDKIMEGKPLFASNVLNDLITVEQFESMINLTPFVRPDRFIPTHQKHLPEFTWNVPYWSTENNGYPSSVLEHVVSTGTCYIKDASRITKNINEVCGFLESKTNIPTDCHIFFSMNPTALQNSFGVHKDRQHNIIVQVDGRTHWKVGTKIHDVDVPNNIEDFFEDDNLSVDIEMAPGDAVVIPAGVFHQPKNITKRISASFSMAVIAKDGICVDRKWVNW